MLERASAEVSRTPAQRAVLADAVLGLRDTTRPAGRAAQGRHRPLRRGGARRPAAARVRVPVGRPTPARRARARPVGRLVRVLPAQRGRDLRREGAPLDHRHAPHRREAAARHRRDGLRRRLPHPGPPDRAGGQARARTTPSTPAPRTPAAPTRSARPTAATTPSTPTSAPSRTSTPSSPSPAELGHGGRPGPRAAVLPRPPVGDRPTPSGSPPAPTAPSPTPRTRRRSTRTSTRSTSTTTPPASTPRCAGSCRCGSTTASRCSGSTTRTPSRWSSGSG